MTHLVIDSIFVRHIAPMDWRKKISSFLSVRYRNLTTRKQLRDLPEYLLADIGIDKDTAMKEANRSFMMNSTFF